jgi:hypothetical protein
LDSEAVFLPTLELEPEDTGGKGHIAKIVPVRRSLGFDAEEEEEEV